MARLGRALLLLAGLVAAGLLLRAAPAAAEWLSALGRSRFGALAFVPAGAALCALGLPRQAVAYAGGIAFGLQAGAPLALAAQALGCLIDVAWARGVAREWTRRRLGRRLARLDARLAAHPFTVTLLLRLLPVGNNLALNLMAGVSSVALGPFLAASALGYAPQTVVFALAGAGARPGRTAELAVAVALFAASAALGALLLARLRRADPAAAAALSADAADARCAAAPTR